MYCLIQGTLLARRSCNRGLTAITMMMMMMMMLIMMMMDDGDDLMLMAMRIMMIMMMMTMMMTMMTTMITVILRDTTPKRVQLLWFCSTRLKIVYNYCGFARHYSKIACDYCGFARYDCKSRRISVMMWVAAE